MDDQQNLELAQVLKSLTERLGEATSAVNSAAQSANQAAGAASHAAEVAKQSAPAAPPVAPQQQTANDVQAAFAGIGGGAQAAGEQRTAELVAKQGYAGFYKQPAVEAFRASHPGWQEQVVDGETRFSPPSAFQAASNVAQPIAARQVTQAASPSGVAAMAQSIIDDRAKQQRRKDLNSIPTAILQGVVSGKITDPAILASIQDLAAPPRQPDVVPDDGNEGDDSGEQEEGSGWGAAKLFTRIPYYLQRVRRGYTKHLGRDIGRDMEEAGFSKETTGRIGAGAEWAGKTLGPTLGAFAAGGAARWATQFGLDRLQHGQVGQAVGSLGSFAGGQTNAGIAGGMVQSGTSAVSGVVGGATTGAMLGSAIPGIGTAAGAIIGGIAGASLEIAKLPERVNEWSKALVDSKRGIAQWNGALTQYFAEAEWRQYRRDIESGKTTGDSVSRLGHAWQNLQDQTQPTKDWMTNVLADILTNATRTVESGHTLATNPRRWWSGGGPDTAIGKATEAELGKLREEMGIKPPNVSSPWLRQLSPFSVLDGPSKATPDKESRERLIKATNDQVAKLNELLKELSRTSGLTPDRSKELEAERALILKEMASRGLKEKTTRTNVQEWAKYWMAQPMKSHYVPRRR